MLNPQGFFAHLCSCLNRPIQQQRNSQPQSTTIVKLSKKKLLLLDIDETLVHSSSSRPSPNTYVTITPTIDGKKMTFNVILRDNCIEFIQRMSLFYEIGIWTASPKEYADLVIEAIDPDHLISLRYYRENCTQLGKRRIKDLARLARDLSQVILLDNTKDSFNQPENGLLIKSFYSKGPDFEFQKMIPVLERMARLNDVRPVQKNFRRIQKSLLFSGSPELSASQVQLQTPSSVISKSQAQKADLSPIQNTQNQNSSQGSIKNVVDASNVRVATSQWRIDLRGTTLKVPGENPSFMRKESVE